MATSFGAHDIRFPDGQEEKEPEVVQEQVEEIESGPMEVPVIAPSTPAATSQ